LDIIKLVTKKLNKG